MKSGQFELSTAAEPGHLLWIEGFRDCNGDSENLDLEDDHTVPLMRLYLVRGLHIISTKSCPLELFYTPNPGRLITD